MSDFQHFAKSSPAKELLYKALIDTIVTISEIPDFLSIYQNIRTLYNSRYKLIKNSESLAAYSFFDKKLQGFRRELPLTEITLNDYPQ